MKKLDLQFDLIQIQTSILVCYQQWLQKLNEINGNTRYSKKDLGFGASSAGLCHLKHYFRLKRFEKKETADDSMRKMRLGTLVHEDIQQALLYMFDDKYKVMCEIPIEYKRVKGHLDIAVEIDKDNVALIDIKTMAAYSWSKKYGRKDPDPNPAPWNKLQLATYSLGLKNQYGYKNVHMYLLNYNKNTSAMRFEPISNDYEKAADLYWDNVERSTEYLMSISKPISQLSRENTPRDVTILSNSPKYTWECNYCDYSEHCPFKIEKGK